jgi:hypothetical protein
MVKSTTCAWLQRRNNSQPLLWRARIIRWLNLESLLDTEWVTQVHHKPWFCESRCILHRAKFGCNIIIFCKSSF